MADDDGTPTLILFSSPEQAKDFVKDFAGYEGGLLTEFTWVLSKMGAGYGIALNLRCEVGFDMPPTLVAGALARRPVTDVNRDATVPKSGLGSFLAAVGVLRVGMIVLAVATVVLAPRTGMPMEAGGWGLVRTVLAPVLAPIMFMLLLLDALMSRVFMTDQTGGERRRLRQIVLLDLMLAGGLLAYWLPYFLA